MIVIEPIISYDPSGIYTEVLTRPAVKAVCFRNNKIVVLKCADGSYKLPGGGVEKDDDSNEMALSRELKEECGITEIMNSKLIAHLDEFKQDELSESTIFNISTNVFHCHVVSMDSRERKLDDYESELGMTVEEVSIKKVLSLFENQSQPWSKRDLIIIISSLEILRSQEGEKRNEYSNEGHR